jgi:hypothetical protein
MHLLIPLWYQKEWTDAQSCLLLLVQYLQCFPLQVRPNVPTLADVHMLTGLNIVGHINPFSLLVTPTIKLGGMKTGGWSQYIINHKANGRSVSDREHTTFLNMWLDRYIFCGQACSWTSNYLTLAEKIVGNSEIPLGKILLGALYNLLNKVS